jgi:hypothetical protein
MVRSPAVAACICALAVGCSSGVERLHGNWEGADAVGKPAVLTFGPSNTVRLRVGPDMNEGTYAVDWSKSPAHLDIDWGKWGRVETLVEVAGGTLRMEDNAPGAARPTAFSDRAVSFARSK